MFKKNFRWAMMVFIMLIFFIQFVDRVIISVATGPMMEEFGLSPSQWGIVLSAFFWGLVPFGVIAGIAADRFGAKKVFTVGAIWWSLFTAATAGAFGFVSLIIARIFFGAGEGPSLSSGVRIVTNWFSPKEYSSALGLAFSAVYLGPALATPILAWMIVDYGWRFPFIVMGIVGLIWTFFWHKLFTDRPEANKRMSKEEKEWLLQEQGDLAKLATSGEKKSVKDLLTIPKGVRGTMLANMWAFFCVGYALFFLLTWLPGYLSLERGLDLKSMGFALSVPWIGAALGQAIGGRLSDTIYKRTNSRRIARAYWTVFWFCILAVSLVLVVQSQTVIGAVVFLTIGAMSLASAAAPLGAVVAETVPEKAGSMGGLAQVAQTLPGILAPIITGFIVEATNSFNNAFYLAAIIIASGVVIVALFSRPPERLAETSEEARSAVSINIH
ncbi:MFS transporter [Sporosarcina sp. ACRSM]|uniref:MFS transporter n=1 Tax=Sporosarcina sp. ACRSM TaxID=2918216 RepID=UPI001EF5F250|nr:MFS transporter [Sporosarcina sp. ACRSM]MCG7335802.1 MFS transporter [Sporosarcina sp. ACRSM]